MLMDLSTLGFSGALNGSIKELESQHNHINSQDVAEQAPNQTIMLDRVSPLKYQILKDDFT